RRPDAARGGGQGRPEVLRVEAEPITASTKPRAPGERAARARRGLAAIRRCVPPAPARGAAGHSPTRRPPRPPRPPPATRPPPPAPGAPAPPARPAPAPRRPRPTPSR